MHGGETALYGRCWSADCRSVVTLPVVLKCLLELALAMAQE